MVAVGAQNPDGTVALFSNTGPWVQFWATGAAVVSTIPTSFDGSHLPEARTLAAGRIRASLDPDNFCAGFAVWTGTSFAAPIVAAEIAEALRDASEDGTHPLPDDAGTKADALARARAAVAAVTERPPS